MKDIIMGLAILSVLFAICPPAPATDKPKDADVIKITAADEGKTIKAPLGKKLEIHLAGNPTTGFQWQIGKIKGKAIKAEGKATYVPDKYDPPRMGSGGIFIFPLAAVKPGKASIELKYIRPWEKDVPPNKIFKVNIEVTEN